MKITKELWAGWEKIVAEACREHFKEQEKLTEEQFFALVKQLLQSGDFERLVRIDGAQQLIYLPYQEVERLREENRQLKSVCTANDIDWRIALFMGEPLSNHM